MATAPPAAPVAAAVPSHAPLAVSPAVKAAEELHTAYTSFAKWALASLDVYKPELMEVAYPLFLHTFVELLKTVSVGRAHKFLREHRDAHVLRHSTEMEVLSAVTDAATLNTVDLVRTLLNSKYLVTLSVDAKYLLMTHLKQAPNRDLMALVNKNVTIRAVSSAATSRLWLDGSVTAARSQRFVGDALALSRERAGAVTGLTSPSATAIHWGVPLTQRQLAALPDPRNPWPVSGSTGTMPAPRTRLFFPILQELSCFKPKHVAAQEEADMRARVSLVGKRSANVTAACFTLFDADSTLCCTALSKDATTIVAGFTDACVRVWRLDDQPIGTPYGGKPPVAATAPGAQPSSAGRGASGAGTLGAGAGAGVGAGSAAAAAAADVSVAASFRKSGAAAAVSTSLFGELDGDAVDADGDVDVDGDGGGDAASSRLPPTRHSAVLPGHASPVSAVALSSDMKWLVSGAMDGSIRLWDLALQCTVAIYRGHDFPVWDLAFSPLTASLFASGGRDGVAYLWNTAAPAPVRMFVGHTGDVNVVAIHPNSHFLVTGSQDSTLRLWNLESGACAMVLSGHTAAVTAVAMSPDGRFVASAARDFLVRVWDLKDHAALRVLLGHSFPVSTLCFSGASGALVSASIDGVVRVWDMHRVVNLDAKAAMPRVPGNARASLLGDPTGAAGGDADVATNGVANGGASGAGAGADGDGDVPVDDDAPAAAAPLRGRRGRAGGKGGKAAKKPAVRAGKRRRTTGEPNDDDSGSGSDGDDGGAAAAAGSGGAGAASGDTPADRPEPHPTRIPQGYVSTPFLASTFVTKSTRVVGARFTTTNLLTVCGVFTSTPPA